MSSKNEMFANVILASKHALSGTTLFTIHARYPRIFHSELMTHRDFSRNAGSSRAKPVMGVIKEVWNAPFIPWHWGQNQKRMQAGAPLTGWRLALAKAAWVGASKVACVVAYGMVKLGLHKQIPNRLLEPFTFIDVLISSTKWENFLHLRNHKDAEPHFQDLAKLFKTALHNAVPQVLEEGQWHLPYVSWSERRLPLDVQIKLSVARSARISYAPFDGDASIEKEIARYTLLVGSSPLHASPAEHQAQADKGAPIFLKPGSYAWDNQNLSGNFDGGFIQYRKTLHGEVVREAA